jgi:hypothetical protein
LILGASQSNFNYYSNSLVITALLWWLTPLVLGFLLIVRRDWKARTPLLPVMGYGSLILPWFTAYGIFGNSNSQDLIIGNFFLGGILLLTHNGITYFFGEGAFYLGIATILPLFLVLFGSSAYLWEVKRPQNRPNDRGRRLTGSGICLTLAGMIYLVLSILAVGFVSILPDFASGGVWLAFVTGALMVRTMRSEHTRFKNPLI